ncbi:MAG: general secretion pathway protein GspK [Gammaproteobacteria bacterium]|nr:MAG: general secretion pathway protein GspK [Gammaproteobacteria bacterium]
MKSPNVKSITIKSTREAGAVLIMVILIVALVAGLSIKFAGDYQLGLIRAEARWHGSQARAYLFSGEGAAIKFLATDDANTDYPEELWGQVVPVELPDNMGNIMIRIEDANSRFNLNSLAGNPMDPAKSSLEPTRYSQSQRMFIRLLQTLPSEEDPNMPMVSGPDEAVAILEAIVDWTDVDKMPSGSGGAEDDFYLSQPDPYQAANMTFRSIEELQMVRGISPQIMRALRPFLTALEPNERLNINTMHEVFFRCINVATDLTPLSRSQADALRAEKPTNGFYANISDFDSAWNKVSGASGASVDKNELTVNTKYFWLTTAVQIGDQRRVGRSLLMRGAPAFKVVRREEGSAE